MASRWHGNTEGVFAAAKERWERLWQAAFTPDNGIFSGHLPTLHSPHDAMQRLYYNGILTLLTCRRVYPGAVAQPAYLTLWPRRGEGSAYLAWELNCTSGILARLDPEALRSHWLLLASAPWLDYQVTNFFTGEHGGWVCCAQPQSLIHGALNLQRWNGDTSWQRETILRKPRRTSGFEAASQGQVVDETEGASTELTGRAAFEQAVFASRLTVNDAPAGSTMSHAGERSFSQRSGAGLKVWTAWAFPFSLVMQMPPGTPVGATC